MSEEQEITALKRIATALEKLSGADASSDDVAKLFFELRHDQQWLIDRVKELSSVIHRLVELHEPPPASATLVGAVTAIYGRRILTMSKVDVPKLLDTEKIMLSVMPRKADGHVDVNASVSWASSDEAQVGVVVGTDAFAFHDPQFDEDVTCPGAFNAFATTPGRSGHATVTASCDGYEAAEFGPIVYEAGQPRSLNASVGSPVSDLI